MTFPIRFVSFFVSSVCLLVRVTVVDKNKAVVCCLLATSAILLFEKRKRKRKMCSKKWYLKREYIMRCWSAEWIARNGCALRWCHRGKMRKLWDSLSELRISVCERRWKRQFWGLRYCLSKLRSLLRFFRQVWRHTLKSLSLTESVWGALGLLNTVDAYQAAVWPL